MFSPEREKQIRDMQITNWGYDDRPDLFEARDDLLGEIDRLRSNEADHIHVYDMLLNEQKKTEELEAKLDIAIKAIERTHKYADPEFGWGQLLAEALNKIRGEKNEP